VETGKIKREREALLKKIKELPPGPIALKELAYLREEYDCSNEDYLTVLKILSDTTYQNRKHFLLELN
jgi:HD-like signal output (HDOD) protein